MAVNHHEQLWVGFAAHRNGFTNQYMTYLKHFLMIETLLNYVDDQWDLCIVLPRVVRSIVPPVRREDEELGGTVDGPWSQLFEPGAATAFIEQLWRAIGAQGHRRPRQVFVFDDAPDAVPMPTIFAGRVNVRGQWHVDDPERAFLREQEVIGHEWVPDAKFQTCEGGGFKSLTGKRGRDGPLYRDPRLDLAPYNSPEAVAQRLALKLPYRALAGEGALVHTMFTCGPIFRGELITPGRVDALTPGAVPMSLAKTVIDRLRAMSIESGGNGRYSSMHIRLERDWAVACEESHSDACLSEHALAEVPRCLQWKHSLDKLLYVATGEETARSQVMRTFKLYMRRNVGVTVVTKFDMGDDVAALFKSDDARYGRVSREELAAAEYAIVHDASSFMGWAVGTTFSWVQVLRAGAVQGRPAFFFANDCPGMLDEKYLMYKPFHKGYTPFTPPPRPSDYAGRAEWDMHFDNAQRLAQWNEAARDS